MHTSLAMESNNSQEQYSSKSSSEQTDRSDSEQTDDHVNSMVSGGRFYECVFCKRGFTTAQALGGHMNIHRKDRAKTKRSSVVPSSSSKPDDEDYVKFRSSPSIASNLQPQYYVSAPDQVHTYYQNYFAPSTVFGFKRPSYAQYSQNQRTFNLFGEDWKRNFGCIDDDKGKMEAGSEDNDLDLELRLGHYP